MNTYLRIDEANRVSGHRVAKALPEGFDGNWFVEYTGDLNPDVIATGSEVYVYRDGVVTNTGEPLLPPHRWSEWDSSQDRWIDTRGLEDHKAAKWEEIKQEREAVLFGTLTFAGNDYDIDTTSQLNIMGAAQLALFDQETVMTWTLTDNSSVVLTAADLIGLGQALGQHKDSAHQTARQLREAINTATTEAEIAAIVWPE